MKLIYTFAFLTFFTSIVAQSSFIDTDFLIKAWETNGFDTPESVLLNSEEGILYISNIGGMNPTEKDGNGFISTMKTNGEISELKWATGLNAPKGMAISMQMLYVTDIDRLVKISLKSGKVVETIPVKDAVFLNDIAVTKNGSIIISDSKGLTYYMLLDGKLEKFLHDSSFHFPNGLCVVGDKIFSGVGDKIISFTEEDSRWSDYILETGGVDGLSKVDDNSFIISDWQGKVHLVYTDRPKVLILDTGMDNINAADFHYESNEKLLFIPTFFHNSVSCYKLKD